jgi:hypothetical protein
MRNRTVVHHSHPSVAIERTPRGALKGSPHRGLDDGGAEARYGGVWVYVQ